MEIFSALLAFCAGNSPATGEFPSQRPVTRSFDVYFDIRLNKRWSKQWWSWWFETPACSLRRHCNVSSKCVLAENALQNWHWEACSFDDRTLWNILFSDESFATAVMYALNESKMLSIWHPLSLLVAPHRCHDDNLRCHQWRQSCHFNPVLQLAFFF